MRRWKSGKWALVLWTTTSSTSWPRCWTTPPADGDSLLMRCLSNPNSAAGEALKATSQVQTFFIVWAFTFYPVLHGFHKLLFLTHVNISKCCFGPLDLMSPLLTPLHSLQWKWADQLLTPGTDCCWQSWTDATGSAGWSFLLPRLPASLPEEDGPPGGHAATHHIW